MLKANLCAFMLSSYKCELKAQSQCGRRMNVHFTNTKGAMTTEKPNKPKLIYTYICILYLGKHQKFLKFFFFFYPKHSASHGKHRHNAIQIITTAKNGDHDSHGEEIH